MIIPSIDIMGGKVVQLVQGREKKIEIGEAPEEFAKKFAKCKTVQVIDLDAAMERGDNEEILKRVCKIVKARVGGGVRSVEKARRLVDAGAKKVIIGTRADKEFLSELAATIGKERIIVALDSRKGKVAIRGWRVQTEKTPIRLAKELEPYCSEFFYTCVDKEGLMGGTDMKTIRELKKVTSNKLSIAGGISSNEEIGELECMGVDAVVGMALYTGKIKIKGVEIG